MFGMEGTLDEFYRPLESHLVPTGFVFTRVSDPDPYPDPDPHGSALIWAVGSGSGSRRGKMIQKNRKKDRIFIFWSVGCSLLRAEGFSCSLGVLYGGLGISKLQFLIKKIKIKFLVVNPESGSAIRKNAGSGSVSGSALNQCGSETLVFTICMI